MDNYFKGGSSNRFYGLRIKPTPPYCYPKNHPCYCCPYTLNTSLPSCMLPQRKDGSCFWYDLKKKKRPEPKMSERQIAAQKIFDFIKVLEAVQRKKGYVKRGDKL